MISFSGRVLMRGHVQMEGSVAAEPTGPTYVFRDTFDGAGGYLNGRAANIGGTWGSGTYADGGEGSLLVNGAGSLEFVDWGGAAVPVTFPSTYTFVANITVSTQSFGSEYIDFYLNTVDSNNSANFGMSPIANALQVWGHMTSSGTLVASKSDIVVTNLLPGTFDFRVDVTSTSATVYVNDVLRHTFTFPAGSFQSSGRLEVSSGSDNGTVKINNIEIYY